MSAVPSRSLVTRLGLPLLSLLTVLAGVARGAGPLDHMRWASGGSPPPSPSGETPELVHVPFAVVPPLLAAIDAGLRKDLQVLDKMKQLAERGGDGSQNTAARLALNASFRECKQVLNRVAEETSLRGMKVLDGSSLFVLMSPDHSGKETRLDLPGVTAEELRLDGPQDNLVMVTNAWITAVSVAEAIQTVQEARANLVETFEQVVSG